MIQKHVIPILEFDDNPQAVIMPNHEGLDLQLPKKCIYAFLEEEIALVEFIPFLPSNQKMNAVKIAGSKRGKIEFKMSWKSIIFSPIAHL